MRRFSILSLILLVLASGVGLAALTAATDTSNRVVFTLTLLTLTASVVLAFRRKGFWLGFAAFCWVYLIASLHPPVEYRLLTTKALHRLEAWWPRPTVLT